MKLIAIWMGGFIFVGLILAGIMFEISDNDSNGVATFVIVIIIGIVTGIFALTVTNRQEKVREEAEKKKVEELERIKIEEARKQKLLENRNAISNLCQTALILVRVSPSYLRDAEQILDQAEIDFKENALAPFWDSIEKATTMLGSFNLNIKVMEKELSEYTKLIGVYDGEPPVFPLSVKYVEKLKIGTGTAERMQSIVRSAQRNFQFAMIYEQRKTNQILVAGFTSLAQALEQMAQSINTAINDLSTSMDRMSSSLTNSMRRIESRIDDISETTSAYLNGQEEHEKQAIEMLDNIQRGRKPLL